MKLHPFVLATGTALALFALNALAQQPASTTVPAVVDTPAPQAASPASDKAARKAGRKANHLLEKAVRTALVKDKAVDVTRINVRARNGDVTLLGSVPEQAQSETATRVAQGLSGVKSVKNALTIRGVGQ